jgi:hypothetical protein
MSRSPGRIFDGGSGEDGPANASASTCLYCGSELGPVPSAVKGLCIPCARRVLHGEPSESGGSPRAATAQPEPERTDAPVGSTRYTRARLEDALEAVVNAPASQTPGIVRELLAADKRVIGVLALVPFVGPWLLRGSDAHTDREKRILTWISITLTAAILGGIIWRLPTNTELQAQLQRRMEDQMRVLAGIAEQYRSQHGVYAGSSVWRRYAERADPRFYDPWGRPYLYEATDAGVTLGSLGRDGAPGGENEDADVSATFPPAPAK